MPQNKDETVLTPREGHIDTLTGLAKAPVGLSIEVRVDSGVPDPVLHLDVGRGFDVGEPFSVGLHLSGPDLQRVIDALLGASMIVDGPQGGQRLN